ncbi:Mannosyl-oligosaccharide 1,2-alpha-mannosidase [Colletotrichum sidae]|uniref:alpha-1,2-Mannosidase n=1 Tax=Colletotrichum sidae TaxID=1347389 RepID=A0A4R8T8I2_9PEZI|nr:Mannosyl-oligosaccharide 1,2-alpha-mannosidase [Colletotrichum sidae]
MFLSFAGLAGVVLAGYLSDHALGHVQHTPRSRFADWDERRENVKDAFMTSWDAYSKYAWGNDVFHPLSKKGSNMSPEGLGWIIVDSLDTMMLMNLTEPLAEARRWLHRSLTWDQDQDVNTFETTIRMVGGLLSAHHLSTKLPGVASRRDSVYLSKAVDLADRLLAAFESESGDPAERVMRVLDDQKMEGGLLPIFVHPSHGRFTTREIRLGSRGDSYCEYLIKQYLQTGETIYRDVWEDALDGIQTHLVTTTRNAALRYVAELPKARRGPEWTSRHEDEMQLAVDLMDTCWGMYAVTDTGLAPGITWFNATDADLQSRPGDRVHRNPSSALSRWKQDFAIKPLDAHNLQRPETVESLFMMYRVTGDAVGYTSLGDVPTVPPATRDNMESFWLAETLKYLYLLFSPADYMPLTEVVFNTEAHPFPRFTPEGALKTV